MTRFLFNILLYISCAFGLKSLSSALDIKSTPSVDNSLINLGLILSNTFIVSVLEV
ncbi:hypothetical protein FLA4_01070 [Candidatus Rickettsia kotlanii]|nr:hypothetical protein FLA4_01070 [Candidatus Rickettsia kotlanii]BDU60939.1 hypothetical protein HM2_01070 [Candidatus Rickettsia kotlanii]